MLNHVKSLSRPTKQAILLGLDMALVPVALGLTAYLLTGNPPGAAWITDHWSTLVILIVGSSVMSTLLGLPRIQLKSYEISAMGRSAMLAAALAVVMVTFDRTLDAPSIVGAAVVFAMMYLVLSALTRLFLLQILLYIYRKDVPATRVLIYGAGKTGMQLALALKPHEAIRAVGFIDDNSVLHKLTVAGLPVHPSQKLERLIAEQAIDRVLLAMPSLSPPRQAQIARRVAALGVEVQTLPSFAQLVGQEAIIDKLTPILPRRFLGRAHLDSTLRGGCSAYRGNSVMVTGAGGSIGSELCRQLLNCNPARLVLLELSEYALYNVERELRALAEDTGCDIVPVLGSVNDAPLVRDTIRKHDVGVVLHAAAYKHVPLVEANPAAGIANNVFGTQTLAQAALDTGVKRFILISTDKAVRPMGIMGASKRLAELVVQDFAQRSESTVFSMVRFGNVLGSSGSVIPLFQEQILRGGPVTVTHHDVTRYFMTVQEATRLVLWAGNLARGGEIFVLDMGKPIKIADLARQVIEAVGYSVRDAQNPDGDIEIVTTGLRPGEKIYEELSISGELRPTKHPKLSCTIEGNLSEFEITRAVQSLKAMIETGAHMQLAEEAMRWVARDLEKSPDQTAEDAAGKSPH
ncbi:MAG: putative nucleoside-diphosphate sugar epimerase [Rhodobacteraceae bacterium HLUCCA12]|nr:MAG: putative nucleoside-diphosphate sugar epimerase [Rhodobacteraceae bacterium HLUCCA12]